MRSEATVVLVLPVHVCVRTCCVLCNVSSVAHEVFTSSPPPLPKLPVSCVLRLASCFVQSSHADDSTCAKFFPLPAASQGRGHTGASSGSSSARASSAINRNWECTNPASKTYNATALLALGYQFDAKLGPHTAVDLTSLLPHVPPGDEANPAGTVNVCLIVTKRVLSAASAGAEPVPMHKYFCNGPESALNAHETWSSSKVFAIANAAGALRQREETEVPSDTFGIPSSTTGKNGETPLGDLATVVCSYDTTKGYSSNSLSSYFHDVGWRSLSNTLVNTTATTSTNGQSWCGAVPGAQQQTLGGNYGEPTPADLGFVIAQKNAKTGKTQTVTAVAENPVPPIYSNTISSLTAAEMARRIVQHRTLPQDMRFPGMQWSDAQSILYGEETSLLFPGLQLGGMCVDPAIFVQASIADINPKAWLNIQNARTSNSAGGAVGPHSDWRIFSKLGAGWSSARSRGEVLTTAYACFPQGLSAAESALGAEGEAVGEGEGYEFTLSVRGSVPGDTGLQLVEAAVKTAVQATLAALLQGQLPV